MMGLFDWLTGPRTPEARLEAAHKLLARGRPADARVDALALGDLPGAAELVVEAEDALAHANLDAAVSWARAGDTERVEHHLEVARGFHRTALDDAFRAARVTVGELLSSRKDAAAAQERAQAASLHEVDPRFRAQSGGLSVPLPEGVSEAEAEALEARLVMLHDAYPEDLQHEMVALGSAFAEAVIQLEDGQAEAALPALLSLPDDMALVQHERARAAWALRDAGAAARAWRTFADLYGGHARIGDRHTGEQLVEAMAVAGDPEAALTLLDTLRADDPKLGPYLRASLLEVTGRFGEAEQAYRGLLKTIGTNAAFYLGIARVRVRAGKVNEAMQALETSLQQNHCEPGRCGYKPPDLATNRLLATLYLEQGRDIARGLELAETAASVVQQATWDDHYLAALAARAQDDLVWADVATRLRGALPEGDPRLQRLDQHLPVPA